MASEDKQRALNFHRRMVERIQSAMEEIPPGVSSVSIDGVSTTYQQLRDDLEYHQKRVRQLSGCKPFIRGVNLNRSHD